MSRTQPTSLVELLEISVERWGSRPLFLTKRDGRWVETSYAAFAQLVDALRGGLADLGVGVAHRVGIIAANCVEWAAIAHASYGVGAAIVPMYESQSEADWAFVIRDSGLKVLFVANEPIRQKVTKLAASMPGLRHICLLDDAGAKGELTFAGLVERRNVAPAYHPAAGEVAAIMYTSGTTGEPKGVVLTHGNFTSNIATLLRLIPVSERHRTLSFLPWAHAFGHTFELQGVIAAGASMAIAESVDKIVANLAEVQPTVLVAVPRVFLRVYDGVNKLLASKPRLIRWLSSTGLALVRRRAAGERLGWSERLLVTLADRFVFAKIRERVGGRLEFAISGAAALPKEVAEMVDGIGIQVYEGYGLTETSPIVSGNVPGHRKIGSVGRPLPDVRVEIDHAVSGDSAHGEIVVFGPNVMRGYHRRPQETAAAFRSDGGFRTGDLGYLDDDGYLFITGRIKEQYKLANGKYVSPGQLEDRLKLSPLIADIMIHGDGQDCNVALIVPELEALRTRAAQAGNAVASSEQLICQPDVLNRIAEEVAAHSRDFRGYEKIVAFALLPEPFTQQNGLLTPSLKLKRREIMNRWRDQIELLHQRTSGRGQTTATAQVGHEEAFWFSRSARPAVPP